MFLSIGDGGTSRGRFTDAKGREIDFYIDHRIGTKTPGDIYLYHYPDDYSWSYVHIKNKAEFIQKLAAFMGYWPICGILPPAGSTDGKEH